MTRPQSATNQPAGAPDDDWSEPPRAQAVQDDTESLIVDLAGFSGPLDLLLALARTQKVDLTEISVLKLAEQFVAFIHQAQAMRLALAADYLVMAAWLTFLKSRLLLPREEDANPNVPPDELARRLAFRLVRLDAMRRAGQQLMERPRLDRDVFNRGQEEAVTTTRERVTVADLNELLRAYARQRNRRAVRVHVVKARPVWSIKDARRRLERMVGVISGSDWIQLELCLEDVMPNPEEGRTALAASFGASLEMAREGQIALRQDTHFAPLYLKPVTRDDRS
ncbi:MAG: ScpA family protein [Pseudomonadota bacterium]